MSTKTTGFALALIFVSAAHAQESRGTITGHVTDPSGAVISGVQVRAVNHNTGAIANARTNETGSYTLPYLVPGVYDLSAEFTGFKKIERPGVEVRVNDVLNIELAMEVGNTAETVEV
jgi:hypothetical protein